MKKSTLITLLLITAIGALAWAWRERTWQAWHGAPADESAKETAGDRAERATAREPEPEPASRVRRVDGLSAVQMTTAEQRQTGVQLIELTPLTRAVESRASARVIDTQPLVEAQANHHAALAEREALRGSVNMEAGNVARLRVLHGEDTAVSGRQLREAETQLMQDQARLKGVEQRLLDLHAQIEQQWGATLASMALADSGDPLESFINHREVLLLVTLRPGGTLPAGIDDVWVDAAGDRARARQARLIASAVQTDGGIQGETYFFRTAGDGLRVGMRLDAWVPGAGGARQGVEVPASAVIWYADQLWAYRQAADDLFVRTPLPEHEETGGGWFITAGLKAGDRVVVRGAQMLFAEEFRGRIPSEDDGRD